MTQSNTNCNNHLLEWATADRDHPHYLGECSPADFLFILLFQTFYTSAKKEIYEMFLKFFKKFDKIISQIKKIKIMI